MMTLALSGFMGCGKSSVAALLADSLGCPWLDLDAVIEKGERKSVRQIFTERGEAAFRRLETEYLEHILTNGRNTDESIVSGNDENPAQSPDPELVLSLGGGTVTVPECAELLKKHCHTVYLRASVEELTGNILLTGIEGRPLLDGEGSLYGRIAHLLEERKAVYEASADTILDIDGLSAPEIVAAILRR